MKVLHINSNYLTSKLHENLVDGLSDRGVANTIYMPIKKETQDEFLYESKHQVYHPVAFTHYDRYLYFVKQRKIIGQLEKILEKDRDFDLVHAHTLFTDGNVAYELKKKYGLPYVVTVRGYTDIHSFFRLRVFLRRRGREILRHADQIVFLSAQNRDQLFNGYIKDPELRANLEEKSHVIPNGIDSIYFEQENQAKTLKKGESLRLIEVGKIMALKNQHTAMEAVEAYSEMTGHPASFTMVGKVVETDYMEKIERDNPGNTYYHEPVPPERLIELYRQHDIFLMPSQYETFGLVYPEAMSQGLPIIYTQGQGFDGQFPEGYVGYRVDPNDPEDIAQKIKRIVDNYEDLSRNALEAYRNFHWKQITDRYLDLYQDARVESETI